MSVTIYHNPRCSKSRQTLAILNSQPIDIEIIEYLQNPPNHNQLKGIISLLDMSARDLMRKNEKVYKDNKLDNPDLTDDQLVEIMTQNPILIERPIVLNNDKAIIGRPPQRVLEIL